MKNTLWTFGDSFTEETFLSYRDRLIEIYGYLPKSWVSIISERLDYRVENISEGGISNQEILGNILENIPKIKKGDIVIISDTIPVRTFGFNFDDKKMTTFNNEVFLQYYEENHVDDEYLEVFPHTLDFESKKTLIDYIYTFIIKHENEWVKYWEREFKKIVNILLSNNIECYYWSHKYWKKFTCLSDETNERIEDDHWGPQGDSDFADYLYNRILDKDYFDKASIPKIL